MSRHLNGASPPPPVQAPTCHVPFAKAKFRVSVPLDGVSEEKKLVRAPKSEIRTHDLHVGSSHRLGIRLGESDPPT